MKTRIFGAIFVLTILVALFMLTDDAKQRPAGSAAPAQQATTPSDNDFKNLKIN